MIASASRLPPVFLRTLLVRGTFLWFLACLAALAMLASANMLNENTAASVPVWAIAITPVLIVADLRWRKELMLLHNLGVATSYAMFVGTIPAIAIAVVLLASL